MEREVGHLAITESVGVQDERDKVRRGFLRWPGRMVSPPRPVTSTTIPIPPREATTSEQTLAAARAKVVVTRHSVVDDVAAERLWELYRSNFEPLTELAILEHLYGREEILAELVNPRVVKVIGWAGDQPVGLGMVTTDLDIVPQISPAFLRARYPELAERNAIHYGILALVSPEHRRRTLFARICGELYRIAADDRGVLIFDVSKFNRENSAADAVAEKLAAHFPGGSLKIVDQQTWYAAELPHPMLDQGARRHFS